MLKHLLIPYHSEPASIVLHINPVVMQMKKFLLIVALILIALLTLTSY
jgi:hypothetical protein